MTIALAGCASPRPSENESRWRDRETRRNEAEVRARVAQDSRPYPEGWPTDMLPRVGDEIVVESIEIGYTMAQVSDVMGRASAWPGKMSRTNFLSHLHSCYERHKSIHRKPDAIGDVENQLSASGEYSVWKYQGFPTTAHWIVVFFASDANDTAIEPRVVARGVFILGCF